MLPLKGQGFSYLYRKIPYEINFNNHAPHSSYYISQRSVYISAVFNGLRKNNLIYLKPALELLIEPDVLLHSVCVDVRGGSGGALR